MTDKKYIITGTQFYCIDESEETGKVSGLFKTNKSETLKQQSPIIIFKYRTFYE